MDKKVLASQLNKLGAELKDFSKRVTAEFPSFYGEDPKNIQGELIGDIEDANWQALTTKAKEGKAKAMQKLTGLHKFQLSLFHLYQKKEAIFKELKTQFVPVAKRKDWNDIKKVAIEQWKKDGLSDEAINERIKTLESQTFYKFYTDISKPILGLEDDLSNDFERNLTSYMGYYFAEIMAAFNMIVDSQKISTKNINTFNTTIQKALVTKMKAIQKAVAKSDMKEGKKLSVAFAKYCEKELSGNAINIAASAYLKRQKKNSNFLNDGKSARMAGDTLRNLIFHYAAATYLAWICGDDDGKVNAKDWVQAAKKLSFTPLPAMPADVPIANLSGDTSKYDGKEMSVEGVIKSVEITHLRTKAISNAVIADKDGHTITLALPYIKLDSGGVVPGAFIKIAGTWHTTSKEANFGAALDLDRLSLTMLSKTSWLAWVMLELRGVFEGVPHNINVSYSAEPGKNGAVNSIRYAVYYSNPQD